MDRQFLLKNIIASNNSTEFKLSDDQVLETYELLKHQDSFSHLFRLTTLSVGHSSNRIYGRKCYPSSQRAACEEDLLFEGQGLELALHQRNGTVS